MNHLRQRLNQAKGQQLTLFHIGRNAEVKLELSEQAIKAGVEVARQRWNALLRQRIKSEGERKARATKEKMEQLKTIAKCKADIEDSTDKAQRCKQIRENMAHIKADAKGLVGTPGGVIASLLPGKTGMPIAARLLPSWRPTN